jgi:hypothetical protein
MIDRWIEDFDTKMIGVRAPSSADRCNDTDR